MMKHNNIIAVALGTILLGGGLASCSLDREPKRNLSQNQALLTITDAEAWEAGILARLRASQGGIYSFSQDVQADELTATPEYGNRFGQFADWTKFQAGQYDSRDVYANTYAGMKNINYTIEYLPSLQGLSEADQKKANAILGEAYFARAYSYLELAKRYGKAYNATTAEQDLSVSLLLRYDMVQKPPRATNKEVYAQILSDLAEAEKYLAEVSGSANATKPTIDAVRALKARTYLYMGNYTEALAAANQLIKSNTYPLMTPSVENMRAMWRADGTSLKESIFLPVVSFPSEANQTTPEYLNPNAAKSTFAPGYIPTKTIYNLFEDKDTRKGVYFVTGETSVLSGIDFTDIVLVAKWWGNPALAATDNAKWGKVPDGRMRPKLFRIAEQYLIAAEAAYHTSGDALTPLNALRVSRGLDALVSVSGDQLLQEIRKERQRELAFEGFRLFDLKRWNLGMTRGEPQTSAAGTPYIEDLAKQSYPATDNHFVWPIPYQDVQTGGLKQNPGY